MLDFLASAETEKADPSHRHLVFEDQGCPCAVRSDPQGAFEGAAASAAAPVEVAAASSVGVAAVPAC